MVFIIFYQGVDIAKNYNPSINKLLINYKLKDLQVKLETNLVKLAKVDSTVHTKSASTYKVQGYPTIYFFHKG